MITKYEISWLKENFQELRISDTGDAIEGVVWFSSVYDEATKKFTAFPRPDISYAGLSIKGEYRVKICKNKKERCIPKLWVYIDREKWIPKRHFFDADDGRACMTGPVEEDDLFQRGYSFLEYFESFVIPFLYAQSYFDKNGKWPWTDYDHNAAGILQSFNNSQGTKSQVLACVNKLKASRQWSDIEPILLGRFDGKRCLCGSRNQLNRCHPSLIWIIRRFQQALKNTGVSLR